MVMTWLPYFAFIMYLINRGTSFTQALFMNCDHSLLTYSFYKQPGFVLKLFQIRLREGDTDAKPWLDETEAELQSLVEPQKT